MVFFICVHIQKDTASTAMDEALARCMNIRAAIEVEEESDDSFISYSDDDDWDSDGGGGGGGGGGRIIKRNALLKSLEENRMCYRSSRSRGSENSDEDMGFSLFVSIL